jgi:hypothetical protein
MGPKQRHSHFWLCSDDLDLTSTTHHKPDRLE